MPLRPRPRLLLLPFVAALGLGSVLLPARSAEVERGLPLPGQTLPSPPPFQPTSQVDARWRPSLEAFEAADRAQAPVPGGVLFVGSSSIRLWDGLEKQFEVKPALLKRGFGGSRMVDCAAYVDRLVLRYQPRLVVVYAGDNDLAEGRTPQQVLDDFTRFSQTVHQALPETRIAYLSIKPSPSRASLMPQIREANDLIRDYSAGSPKLDYIDVFSQMLDEQGRPRRELFRADLLHLNDRGYALWKRVIATHLR